MTPAQQAGLRKLAGELSLVELTHGDCVGADAQAHQIAIELGIALRIRPCTLHAQRAYCVGGEQVALPQPPLARNRRIVDDGELLVACPGMMQEQRRSGVWATIRYASKIGRAVFLIWPNGQLERRNQVTS